MSHILLTIFLLWWALNIVRRLIRGKAPDPMAGRLVPRGAFVPTQYQRDVIDKIMERERTQPATEAAPTDLRRLSEEWESARYKYECAKRAWHAGFGPHPSEVAPLKPGHYLKAYWPKDVPLPEGWE